MHSEKEVEKEVESPESKDNELIAVWGEIDGMKTAIGSIKIGICKMNERIDGLDALC